jgi:hypothetical protein
MSIALRERHPHGWYLIIFRTGRRIDQELFFAGPDFRIWLLTPGQGWAVQGDVAKIPVHRTPDAAYDEDSFITSGELHEQASETYYTCYPERPHRPKSQGQPG